MSHLCSRPTDTTRKRNLSSPFEKCDLTKSKAGSPKALADMPAIEETSASIDSSPNTGQSAANLSINLNTSDSGLHHTISLMYVGARHLGFGITKQIVTSKSMYRMLYMLYFARSPIRRNWPSSFDCALFKMFRLVRNRRTAFVGFRKNYISA